MAGKPPWWKLRVSMAAGLESVLAILLKRESTSEVFRYGIRKVAVLKVSENFQQGTFAIKAAALHVCRPAGCNFTENDVLTKYTKLALN